MIKRPRPLLSDPRPAQPARPDGLGVAISSATLLAGALLTVAGCSEPPPPPPPPVVQAPPPPPPPPPITPIDELMARYNIDSRVRLPEERAPSNDPDRIALLTFFDTFARGDSSRAEPMLSPLDRVELEKLVAHGQWAASTERITRIDLRTGRAPTGEPAVLAVLHVGEHFEPQLWSYKVSGPTAEFEAVATPPGIMDALSGDDWVGAWFGVIAKEMELASKPDEELVVPKTDFTPEDTGSTASEEGGQEGPGPAMSPGGPGKRKPNVDNPIAPPRGPGFK